MRNKQKIKGSGWWTAFRIVFSVFCAMLLWVYVTSSAGNNYSQTFSGVSVVYEGESPMRESRGLVITDRYTTGVRITVTGNRRAVSRLDASDLTAVVSLSDIYTAGYKDKTYTIAFPTGVDTSSVSVTGRVPSVVSFEVDRLSTKPVPVEGIFQGSVAPGYSAEALSFNPNTVVVSGPSNVLDQVSRAWVEVSRENVDKTVTYASDFVLQDAGGNPVEDESLSVETPTVEVTLPIISIKEVDLTVKLIDGGGATSGNVKVDIEPDTITLSGDSDTLAGTNNIDIATIDLSQLLDNTLTESYRIVIPNDTQIISGDQEATLNLEIVGLETKQVTVSNLSVTNITEGYEAEILYDSLKVTIRGQEEVLAGISDNNVRAVADLSDYGQATGILAIPAKIYIDGTTAAGAVGTYTIYVRVSQQGQEE